MDMSGSDRELSVCELWLSWLRTGDKPKSTVPRGTFIHAAASKACMSWVVIGAPWLCQSLPDGCMNEAWSGANPVIHDSSGSEAWLHDWVVISGQSDLAHSEAVSGGVSGNSCPNGMDWHQ